MLILIGAIIIIFLLLRSTSSYSDEKLLEISKNLEDNLFFLGEFPITKINSKQKFTGVWSIIVDNIYYYDRLGDIYKVNAWSYCAVKYCTRSVIKYGNSIQKKALTNFAKLMEQNGFIKTTRNSKSSKSYKAKKTIPDNIVVKYMVICGIIGAVITIIFFEYYWVGVGLGLGMIVGILVAVIINNK